MKNKLVNACIIHTEELNNPKIKIVGIDNYSNMDQEEIENDINARNFNMFTNKGKVLHMYNSNNRLSTVLMEVPADIYKHVRENKNKVFVGHQNCKVYDYIKPCLSCCRFGHGKNCRNDPSCLKCSGQHLYKDCDSDIKKCSNCIYSNNTYKTKYNVDHIPSDTSCEILKNKIKKVH